MQGCGLSLNLHLFYYGAKDPRWQMHLPELCPVVSSRRCWQSSFTFLLSVQSNSLSFIANSFQAAGGNTVISIVPCTSAGKEAPGDWTNIPSVGASCKAVDRSGGEGARLNQNLQPNVLQRFGTERGLWWRSSPSLYGADNLLKACGQFPAKHLAECCCALESRGWTHTVPAWHTELLGGGGGSSGGEAAPVTCSGAGDVDSRHGMGCLTTQHGGEREADANYPQTQPSYPEAAWF